jgi:hypothetical protein
MKKILWIGVALLVLAFLGCDLTSRDFYRSEDELPEEGKGKLVLILDSSAIAKTTIAPDPAIMNIYSYDISGEHMTTSDTFSDPGVLVTSLTEGVYSRNGLTPGGWTIDVVARNIDGDQIGSGTTGSFNLAPNTETYVGVDVLPDTGSGFEGSLSLSILWLNDSVPDPSITAILTPLEPSGAAIDISSSQYNGTDPSTGFDVSTANQATYQDTSIAAGYYSLSLDLYANSSDTPEWVMGDHPAIRIVYGQSTSGTWDLTNASGELALTINPDLKNPIEIDITTAPNEQDSTLTDVTATLQGSPSSASYDYAWYVDGRTTPEQTTVDGGTSDIYTLDPDGLGLPTGAHSLSVLVTARDDQGAIDSVSSETHSFTVQ